MKVLDKTVFSAGQSKPILYTDLHSITSFTHDKPVTLVVRHKDKAARGRATTCYMVSCDDGGEQVLSHALSTSRDQDRPASEVEKAEMLEVGASEWTSQGHIAVYELLVHVQEIALAS